MDKSRSLTPDILHIVKHKGTETPHSGSYHNFDAQGTYLCRQCGLALFRSDHKFLSSCGWPSFDDELANALKRVPDKDRIRTEILCQRCEAHLGHVFLGEGLTKKNLRHCVNSLAVEFVIDTAVVDSEEAIYAGGCFWGVQHLLDQQEGVLLTEVGYTGGQSLYPTYAVVCGGGTQHLEAVRVLYDPQRIDYKTLSKLFFEIHDPTHIHGQGPDIGSQYLSAIFYYDQQQRKIASDLISELKANGYNAVTQVLETTTFWSAEKYHQKYYQKTAKKPYCHVRVKRFKD